MARPSAHSGARRGDELRRSGIDFHTFGREHDLFHGDIAAALLTVTPERQSRVAMVSAEAMPVDEVVVQHRDAAPVARLEDLAGQEVQVLRGSSYAEHLRALNQRFASLGLAPVRITVPSGMERRIEYTHGQPPVLAVKLQELFGAASTPTVLGDRLPVTVQLLSPAGRPAAITQDLAGFWSGAYQEVRKELRGRYPRHPWPEDPANTPATALTNRALQRRQSQR